MVKSASKRKIIKSIAIILAVFLILSGLLYVYFAFLHRYESEEKTDVWSENRIFDINEIPSVKKEKGKDFVILNLTDIQLSDIEDFFHKRTIKKEIDYLVREAKPDLITLTGDQTWSNENLISLTSIIGWLESYNIPYAPVFGNHDYGNEYDSAVASLNYCCELYENAEHCLFKRGYSNLGCLGNYAVNVVEDGKIYKTLYMIDAGYNDEITSEQIGWIKWTADGIKTENGGKHSEGMCFMHKPIPEFASAYYSYQKGESQSSTKVLVDSSLYGIKGNDFYSVAKSCKIKYYTAGHQHTNTFSIDYDGSIFTFALKTGELSYYYDDGETNYNGATVFTLGETDSVKNIYVDRNDFHIKGSTNTYR